MKKSVDIPLQACYNIISQAKTFPKISDSEKQNVLDSDSNLKTATQKDFFTMCINKQHKKHVVKKPLSVAQ